MAEPAAPAPEQDKPTDQPTPPPSDDGDKGQVDPPAEPFSEKFDPANLPDELKPAYKQLQAAATRKFQEAAALRQPDAVAEYLRTLDPTAQEEILTRIGIQLESDEPDNEDDEFFDPDDEIRRELQELREWKESQEQSTADERLEDMVVEDIQGQLADLKEATGREFSEQESLALGQIAFDRAFAAGQVPDVRAAYEQIYTELLPHERKRWVDSKRSPQAPSGASASHQPDLDNARERREYLAQRMQDINDTV